MNYVDKNKLISEIIKCQKEDKLSEELVMMAVAIGRGFNKRYHRIDIDEIDSVSMNVIFGIWKKIDVKKTPFNYITSCISNYIKGRHRSEDQFLRLKDKIKKRLS